MASRKRFQNDRVLKRENGTETLLCDVIVVLNIAALLHKWVVRGEGFWCKYKSYFTWEMAKEFTRCSVGIIRLFFVFFLLNYRLATFHSEVKIVGTASFLITSCRKVVRGCQQTPNYKILFEAVFGKALCTNARMLRGRKPCCFIFVSRSLLSFGSWLNLKVLTLDFKWFSSKVHCEVETKTVLNFPHFLSSPTVSSQVLFLTIIQQFSRPLYDYEGYKKQWF